MPTSDTPARGRNRAHSTIASQTSPHVAEARPGSPWEGDDRSPDSGGRWPGEAALFTSLRGDNTGWLRADVVAGLTVWAVLVPEALAYASIAGVSPVVGL